MNEPPVSAVKLPSVLSRYTSLPIALDVLANRHLTLLSPETWEDRNDAYYLEEYKKSLNLPTLVAICFSMGFETFHHWKVFASGTSGACIQFDTGKLLKFFKAKGFTVGPVRYRTIPDVKQNRPKREAWPFLKRMAFQDEKEFRIVYESSTESCRSKAVDIDLTSIRRITLSPWLNEPAAKSVVAVIRSIDGCAGVKVCRSSLLNNADWREAISAARTSH